VGQYFPSGMHAGYVARLFSALIGCANDAASQIERGEQVLCLIRGLVRRAIIDYDDFKVPERLGCQGGESAGEKSCAVKYRHADAYGGHFVASG
jgi:hypothetical protein